MRPFFCLLSLAPCLAQAAETAPGVSTGNYLRVFLGLILILVCLFLCAFMARKFLGSARFGVKGLKLLGGVALGPRERIVLVEAGETWLVIGIVPGQIRTLHHMPRGALEPEPEGSDAPPQPPSAAFADWLRRFSGRRPS